MLPPSAVPSCSSSRQAAAASSDSEQEKADSQRHAARLKREFADLLAELQRRRSPIGDGSVVTCEVSYWTLSKGGSSKRCR